MHRLYLFVLLLLSIQSFSQNYEIRLRSKIGDPIIGAVISHDGKTTISDINGIAYLKQVSYLDTLCLSAFGFQDSCYYAGDLKTEHISLVMLERSQVLQEVEVISDKVDNIDLAREAIALNLKVRPKDIQQLPQVGGEPDVIRPLNFVSGVSAGSPGSVGLNVRGSDLYEMGLFIDGIPLYNANHAFGFASPFTAYPLQAVNFQKQAMSLKYPNASAAVLDVQMRPGSFNQFKGEFALGFGSTRLGLDIPIKKLNSTLITSARLSTFSLANFIGDQFGMELESSFGFEDCYTKFTTRINTHSLLNVAYYRSNDRFQNQSFGAINQPAKTINYKLLNAMSVSTDLVALNHYYKKKGQELETKVFYSRLDQEFQKEYTNWNEVGSFINDLRHQSSLRALHNLGVKLNYNVQLSNKLGLQSGLDLNLYTTTFDEAEIFGEQSIRSIQFKQSPLFTNYAAFAQLDYTAWDFFSIAIGTRQNLIQQFAAVDLYNDHKLSLNANLSSEVSLYAVYEQRHNFLHRFRNLAFGSATDFPVLSSRDLPPSRIRQISTGLVYYLRFLSLNMGAFVRYLDNGVDRDYAVPVYIYSEEGENRVEPDLARSLLTVDGYNYGLETDLKFSKGIFRGSIAYTWTKANRTIAELNKSLSYPFQFNREHMISTTSFIRFKKNSIDKITELGLAYQLGTGNRAQFPLQFMQTTFDNANHYPVIESRNNVQLPPISSLDLQFNFIAKKKRGTRIFTISIVNVLTHINVNSYVYSSRPDGISLTAQGGWRIIPSISYAYKF